MREILEGLAMGSPRQITPEVAERLRVLARDGYTAADIQAVLDTIDGAKPNNPFLVQALRVILEHKQREEDGLSSS